MARFCLLILSEVQKIKIGRRISMHPAIIQNKGLNFVLALF